MKRGGLYFLALLGVALLLTAGCAKKQVRTAESEMEMAGEEVQAPQEATVREGSAMPLDEGGVRDEDIGRSGSQAATRMLSLEDVFFDFDRAVIKAEARRALEQNARWLRENPGTRIVIEGHCDERGTSDYNLALGERRARAVKNVLVALGVEPSRVEIISYGEERPFCRDSGESCWSQNRRGHFTTASR